MLKKLFENTSLKANVIANFIGSGWSALIGLIFIPLYLKYIGAEGYGLIGIFASVQTVIFLLDSGLSTTLNKELAKLNVLPNTQLQICNLVKTLGNIYWIMSIIAGLIALCLSPLIARYWVTPENLSIETITWAFALLSISIVFQFSTGFYSGGLLGLQRQVLLNVLRIVFATIRSFGALLVLIYFSKSVLAFFGWNLIVAIFQAFSFKFILWHYLPKSNSNPKFDVQELKKIWRFAIGMLGINFTAILLTQTDKIILSKILTLEQFGYYTIACTLGLLISQIITPITQSYFPKFSALISLNRIEELKNLYHHGSQMISILVLPVTFIMIFYSKELIFIWTSDMVTVENTWLITAVYAFGTGLNGLINIPYTLTLSYGWTKLGLYQNIVYLIIMIPLTIFYAFKFGALGGALSWVTINTLYILITPSLIHNRLLKGELANWYWKDTFKPFLGSFITVALCKYLIPKTTYSNVVELLLIILVGVLSFIFTVSLTDKLKYKLYSIEKK